MKKVLITGSGGLVGFQAASYYIAQGRPVVGIDNNMRQYFFGEKGSTVHNVDKLKYHVNYEHSECSITDYCELKNVFNNNDFDLIIHAAGQPSHDWAAKEPLLDFSVNATGTINLLELTRENCREAVFIFCSTNKVYGDRPNWSPYIQENETRYELIHDCGELSYGFNEELSIDQSKHSVFGASKIAADIMVQEYGKYFGMNTVSFRGGCLTGPQHSGVKLHGFLSYLMKCIVHGEPYTIFGYKGKQVRDNIHSSDLISAFDEFYKNPKQGEVYNIGGGRHSNCSVLEAIAMGEEFSGKKLDYTISDEARSGDHQWWISDTSKFEKDYPEWERKYDIRRIIKEICEAEMKK